MRLPRSEKARDVRAFSISIVVPGSIGARVPDQLELLRSHVT